MGKSLLHYFCDYLNSDSKQIMAIWLTRVGKHGQHEQKFLQEKRVYATWDQNVGDISTMSDRAVLIKILQKVYPGIAKPKTLQNWAAQLWTFSKSIKLGDLLVVPLKSQPAFCIGEVTGDYHYEANGPSPYFHWRQVKWVSETIPRDHFGQDILNSLGAAQTICRITNNNAEERFAKMRANHWKQESLNATIAPSLAPTSGELIEGTSNPDLEEAGRDQIGRLISSRFKNHDLTRLVEAILKAQGYTTYLSPIGADGGADILASGGPLGFGSPRLCVEVKSESGPIGRPDVDKLLGAVSKFGAQEGLFVSWSGFKLNVFKEMAPSFFKIRLWTKKELLEALFSHYESLDEELKAELPLKRIWTVAVQPDD